MAGFRKKERMAGGIGRGREGESKCFEEKKGVEWTVGCCGGCR